MITATPAYQLIDTQKEAREIVQQVLHATQSVLMRPPRFDELEQDWPEPPNKQDVFVGLFTSGSTGNPKVIWQKRANLLKNAQLSVQAFHLMRAESGDIMILASPWHVAGLSWAIACELVGLSYHMEVPYVKHAKHWAEYIRTHRVRLLFTVPSALRVLIEQGNWHVDELITGGAALTQDDIRQLPTVTHWYTNAYGQTEAGGLISLKRETSTAWQSIHPNNVGKSPSGIVLHCDGTEQNAEPLLLSSPSAYVSSVYATGDHGYQTQQGDFIHLGRIEQGSSGNCNTLTAITSVIHK